MAWSVSIPVRPTAERKRGLLPLSRIPAASLWHPGTLHRHCQLISLSVTDTQHGASWNGEFFARAGFPSDEHGGVGRGERFVAVMSITVPTYSRLPLSSLRACVTMWT